jgi:hypothetical protein
MRLGGNTMEVLLMVVTAVVCGIIATLVARREGIGWWIGDQAAALLGAGFGTYMVWTRHTYKPLDYYLFWVVAFSAGSALFMLMFSNWLLGGEVEDTEPVFVDDTEEEHGFEEYEPVHERPTRRAA